MEATRHRDVPTVGSGDGPRQTEAQPDARPRSTLVTSVESLKTLAFSIPMVARLSGKLAGGRRRAGRPLGLVLAPTRELATQITNTMSPLAEAYDLRVTTILAGSLKVARSPHSKKASTS